MNDQNALEIERQRLQERYDEQPDSRVFAPLADCLRKLGNLQEALGICHTGLTKHPRYSSAYVILGKIHLERGDDAAAREAFERVTEFDPQNLLALRQLAELDEAAGDWSAAVGRWEQVVGLEFDPDAAEERLEAAVARRDGVEPDAEAPDEIETDTVIVDEGVPEAPVPVEPTPIVDAAEEPVEEDSTDGDVAPEELDGPKQDQVPIADLSDGDESEAVEETVIDVPAAEDDVEAPPVVAVEEEIAEEIVEDEIADEIQDEPVVEAADSAEDAEPAFALVEDETPAADESAEESPAESLAEDDEIPTTEIATMTLAEIYAEQGFREKALDILRQVLQRNPDADKVARRIAELEAADDTAAPTPRAASNDVDDVVRNAVDPAPIALHKDRTPDVDDDPGVEPTPPLTARTSPEAEETDERERYGHFKNWLDRIRVDD